MDRRTLIKGILLGTALAGKSPAVMSASNLITNSADNLDSQIKDYLNKIKNYDTHFADDIVLTGSELGLMQNTVSRLLRVQKLVGNAKFALLDFDSALRCGKQYPKVGEFTKVEIDFLESVFYRNPKDYGFFGEKVMPQITSSISDKDTLKVPNTGNYLFKGDSLALYEKIKKDIGPTITLTSGVRGVVKQMYLFLNKAIESDGNLSMASRSLAPPGHSFHGSGDFDVGKVGFGYRNFMEDFANTNEFKRLEELGYIRIRYHAENPFGVRFEPWHIKVVQV